MTEPVDIYAKVRWEIHDEEVRSRRRSGWRYLGVGFVMLLCGLLWPILSLFGFVGAAGLVVMLVGVVKLARAGRVSADIIGEVMARRR